MPDSSRLAPFAGTGCSKVKRHPERAHYDRESVYAILDAALLCHVGYVIDGRPYVTPTLFWRDGDHLYWHGSSASRMLKTQRGGIPVCVTVSHADGLILARSAFRHSLNYRAVMAFGTARAIEDATEKERGFNAFIERLYPGRTRRMRAITPQELKATMLIGMRIEEASAKIRASGPLDLEGDYEADCWAGTVPLVPRIGASIPDPKVPAKGDVAAEIGHLAEGAAFDRVLLALRGRG